MLVTILVITNIVTLAGVTYLYFTSSNQSSQSGSTSCSALYGGPANFGMNIKVAQTLIKSYKNSLPQGVLQSRSVWFSLNQMNRLICEIETKTAANCPNVQQSTLGIRIYNGQYPSASNTGFWNLPGMDPSLVRYAGLNTIVMVPTYNNGVNNVDFDPNYFDAGSQSPISLFQVCGLPMPGSPQAMANVPQNSIPDQTVMMLNHGSLVPPPFDPPPPGYTSLGLDMMNLADIIN